MTETLPNDGLLKAARILTTIFQVLLGAFFIGLIVLAPVVLLSQSHIADEMLPDAVISVGTVAVFLALVILLIAATVGLAFVFLRALKQMINSVGDGDPFIAENADRLRRMAWIVVIIECIKIPAGAIATFIAKQVKEDLYTLDIEFSLTGIFVALVLFILARVFRHGAAMRADLEGTV